MKLTVFLTDGGLSIGNFDRGTLDDMLNEFDDSESKLMHFQMDGGSVYVNKDHIVRFDLD